MRLILRPGTLEDAGECGSINYEAFKSIAAQHHFLPEVASVEVATAIVTMRLSHPGFYSVVAELDGKIVGSNFLDERSAIAGIGPVTVDPPVMNGTIGRQLMQAVMERATQRRFPGVRLVEIAWHYRALALYTKLGFDSRETLSAMQGKPFALTIPGYEVRPAQEEDLSACNRLCFRVHGHDRPGELLDAIRQGTANVVERLGRITGYSTGIGWSNHAIAETNDDLKALIGATPVFVGLGFLVPSRNGELFRWCLSHGLRVVSQATLMTLGLYNEPIGVYLPSISY
ncbi:MAG TPA: GNAT family N-acetyltransferase [Candidatus Competibacteraceae bacterium]|nr:GNAT family N-acetyltransferase [Candidatus Competibacteraceae bacterium]